MAAGDGAADGGRRHGTGRSPLAVAFTALGVLRRPLYGFAAGVSALAAAAIAAIAVLGYALAWDAFGLLRETVAANAAAEDPPFSNTGDSEVVIRMTGLLAGLLLLLLLALVLALLHSAHAVAVRRHMAGGAPLGAGGLWRAVRPRLGRVLGIHLLLVLGAAASVLAGVLLFDAMGDDLLPGITRPRSPFTGFGPHDWVLGLGIPLLTACAGPYLGARLSLSGCAVVFEDAPALRALARSWTLTRRLPARVLRAGASAAVLAALAAALLWWAAAPLARPAGAAMLAWSGGNVHTAAAFAAQAPAAAAAVLLPAAVMPPLCMLLCVLYVGRTAGPERGDHAARS